MAKPKGRIIDRLVHRAVLRNWAKMARDAEAAELSDLRAQRSRARLLKQHVDQLIHIADGRLSLPAVGSTAMHTPYGTDWSWRPALWKEPLASKGVVGAGRKTSIDTTTSLFHDCTMRELSLRQFRNTQETDLAPFGLRLDVFKFSGTFLSLVIDLPPEAADRLTRRQIIRMDTIVEREVPIEIFARLNIQHGPNTEQLVRALPPGERNPTLEFDLAYTEMNEKRVDKLWLDFIFDAPEMNQITIRDVTFVRFPRAEL